MRALARGAVPLVLWRCWPFLAMVSVLILPLQQPAMAVVSGDEYNENTNANMNTQESRGTKGISSDDVDDAEIEKMLDELGWKGQVGQMVQMDISLLLTTDDTQEIRFDQVLLDKWIGEYGVGSVLNNHYPWTAVEYRNEVIRLQQTAKGSRRPPVIWGLDSVHGANYVRDALVTPQPINLAASFNTSLSFAAGALASRDTRRAGIPWLFSPLLGLSWNPFWSRVYETFGEDPLLVGDMAESMTRGIQALDASTNSSLLPSRAAACAKHFVGYSYPHNGHDRAPSRIPMRHLYQYFLLPWRKALLELGDGSNARSNSKNNHGSRPMTVMESYTEIDGVPNVANRRTLDRILRKELGFGDGMLVTDYNEITNLERWHHVASDGDEALWRAMADGTIDMSMIGNLDDVRAFFEGMERLSAKGDEKLAHRVRESARRVLKLKKDLGMFSESFRLQPLEEEDTGGEFRPSESDVEAVLDMTRQSVILAKNENNALPLLKQGMDTANQPLKILVTGPTSDSLSFQTGGWTGEWQGVNSNYEGEWFSYGGYKTVLGALRDEAGSFDTEHECGVDIMGNDCSNGSPVAPGETEDEDENPLSNLLDVVKGWIHFGGSSSASSASSDPLDAIVVCLGEENYAEKPGDIEDLRLPQGQYDLVKALKEVIDSQHQEGGGATRKTKIILVYFGGRPRLLADVVPLVDAVVLGFLPGPFAGNAIADFFTGRANPDARLPLTYPKHQDLGGIPYLREVSDMCTEDTGGTLPHWNNVPCEVQWPFGHGLSYSRFEYDKTIQLSTTTLQQHWHDGGNENKGKGAVDERLSVTVRVTNSGDLPGAETVLFFTFDESRSTTPEYKRLRAYEKVWLEPGMSKDVTVTISLENDLRFVGPHDDSHYILQDKMKFRVGIGPASDCRNNADDQMCSETVTIRTEKNYVGACEAACNLWRDSGESCAKIVFPSKPSTTANSVAACRESCASIRFDKSEDGQLDNDGWGWNYVECLESILGNESFDSKDDCWKLTTLCRDVTQTFGMDEFGSDTSGSTVTIGSGGKATEDSPPLAVVLSLLSGIFASVMILYTVRGGYASEKTGNTKKRGEYGDVEFSAIDRGSNDITNSEVSLTL